MPPSTVTRYQLSIEAQGLHRGIFRRPCPYAIVKVSGGPFDGQQIGRTESLHRTTQADWVKILMLNTDSSIFMPLRVSVYDDRGPDRDHKLLAEANFEATEIYQSVGHTQYEDTAGGVRIYVSMEESEKGPYKGHVELQLRGLDIRNVEPGILGLGRSDPFFQLSKKNSDHAAGIVRWNMIYQSKHYNNHLNPYWDPFTFSLEELCNGDLNWPLKISVFDFEPNDRHGLIGEVETTLVELLDRVGVKGNADRGKAYEIFVEGRVKSQGLVCVVKADLQLEEGPALTNTPASQKNGNAQSLLAGQFPGRTEV